eukprot:CAMPEP_0197555252 /NCGR_PEP_ID=MMETSP1320-20131121/12977_1 /TAXON_ID=91990 /ORGANISM="Bolidomonas sp., Strain RCC2347" /LENGTH=160 /DNA_ID=CAMNT_0043116249 /DNA_START=394 /DNA_END=876 /DNA_ORIENTATION=+
MVVQTSTSKGVGEHLHITPPSTLFLLAATGGSVVGSQILQRWLGLNAGGSKGGTQFPPGTFPNVLNIVVRLIGVVVIVFFSHRFATYFGPEGDNRMYVVLIFFLVATNSTVGNEIRRLVSRYVDGEEETAYPQGGQRQEEPHLPTPPCLPLFTACTKVYI